MDGETRWRLWSARSQDGPDKWIAARGDTVRVLDHRESVAVAREILRGRADAWNAVVAGCDGECEPPDETDAQALCNDAAVRLAAFLCEQCFWHLAVLWTEGPRAVYEQNPRKWEAAGFHPDDPRLFLADETVATE